MRLWLMTVFILFALVQLFQWVRGVMLPLPIYVLAGAFLAIASNYEKGLGLLLKQSSSQNQQFSQTATLVESRDMLDGETFSPPLLTEITKEE